MPEIASIGLMTAFAAGVVSFLSPCVLPLVPGYVSYVAGRSVDELAAERSVVSARLRVLGLAGSFVIGFSAVFVALGASASLLGRLFQSWRSEADLVAGAVIVLFGLHMTGLLRRGWLARNWQWMPEPGRGSPAGAFVLGTAFAFGWTPCIGPVLGAILTLGATAAAVSQGATLLGVYAAGLAVPFLLAALFTGAFISRMRRLTSAGRWLQPAAGVVLVAVGVAMMTGWLTAASTWMLNNFPGLSALVI